MYTSIDRRQFIASTIASATACSGFSTTAAGERSSRETGAADDIIDTHVYVGTWPHAHLPSENPRDFVERLRQNGIKAAWAGSFEGLFHKDIAAVNERLASDFCQGDALIPFGTVNPTLPDWEDDLRRCHETHHMAGIRLHPSYHGYELDDSRLRALLSMAAAANLIVQLVVWLDDTAHRWLTPMQASQDLKPTVTSEENESGKPYHTLERLIIAGANVCDIAPWKSRFSQPGTYYDTTRIDTADKLQTLLKAIPAEQILFGSANPIHTVAAQRLTLKSLSLAEHQRAIGCETARALLSVRQN